MTKHQTPASIRNEVFGHRMRGLDEDEVRDYLDILADQVEAMGAELDRRRREIDDLQAENRRLRDQAQRATELPPQTVALLDQAQQVADQVVEEAVMHARDLMKSVRSERRDILRGAYQAAEEATRLGNGGRPRPTKAAGTPAPEKAEVRTSDRLTQAELRSVVDVLTGKWDRGRSEDEPASIYDQVRRVRGRRTFDRDH